MELDHLSVIDWNLATKLAGNNEAFAEEILELLTKNLPGDILNIKQLYTTRNYIELRRQVHKLHGAICYCGLPRLKNVMARIENNLKKHILADLPFLLSQLDIEVNLLLEQIPTTISCRQAG